MKRYWFKRKRYGWGWVPVTWQGWATVGGYIFILLFATLTLEHEGVNFPITAPVLAVVFVTATAGLIILSFRKGPWPRWRWGAKPDDDPMADF